MLLDTYTWGAAGDALVFDKRFDAEGKAQFAVGGLSVSNARVLTVSHQRQSGGKVRTLLDFTETDPIPDSTTGATVQNRVYAVLDFSIYKTEAQKLSAIARFAASLSNVAFVTKLIRGEV